MTFLLQLLFFVLALTIFRHSFINLWSEKFNFLHQHCLIVSESETEFKSLIQALVCGESFSQHQPQIYTLFVRTGLIHIMVVSASHLSFLKKIIQIFLTSIYFCFTKIRQIQFCQYQKHQQHQQKNEHKHQELFQLLILGLYVAVCQFNAPVFRAWLFLGLQEAQNQSLIKISKASLLLLTGLFCLTFNYTWLDSISFQMSWLTALILISNAAPITNDTQPFLKMTLQEQILKINTGLKTKFKISGQIFLIFFPTFFLLGFPPLTSLFVGLVGVLFIEFFILPLAFMSLFSDFALGLFTFFIKQLLQFLNYFNFNSVYFDANKNYVLICNYFLIFSLHFFLEQKIKKQNLLILKQDNNLYEKPS